MNINEIDSLLLQEIEEVRGGLTEGKCECKNGAALGKNGEGSCSCNSQAKLAEDNNTDEDGKCSCSNGTAL